MPKAKGRRRQVVDFDTYLNLVMSLEGEAREVWNREGVRRSKALTEEIFERDRLNREEYLRSTDAEQTLAEERKYAGESPVKWEIDMKSGKCRLSIDAGDTHYSSESWGHPVDNRVAVKHFLAHIKQHLVTAHLTLWQASEIYASEKVKKSNPHHWRQRFINREIQRLEALTGKPSKSGRPEGTVKSCLQVEDDADELKAEVIDAVRNLYSGESEDSKYCPRHGKGKCPGHDIEEINREFVAGYLGRSSPSVLGNELSRYKLKFTALRKEALADVIK